MTGCSCPLTPTLSPPRRGERGPESRAWTIRGIALLCLLLAPRVLADDGTATWFLTYLLDAVEQLTADVWGLMRASNIPQLIFYWGVVLQFFAYLMSKAVEPGTSLDKLVLGFLGQYLVLFFVGTLIAGWMFLGLKVPEAWNGIGQALTGLSGTDPVAIADQGIANLLVIYFNPAALAAQVVGGPFMVVGATVYFFATIAFVLQAVRILVINKILWVSGPIFLALGSNRYTAGMADNYLRLQMRYGIEAFALYLLMALWVSFNAFVIAEAGNVWDDFGLQTFTYSLRTAFGMVMMAGLAWFLPSMFSGITEQWRFGIERLLSK